MNIKQNKEPLKRKMKKKKNNKKIERQMKERSKLKTEFPRIPRLQRTDYRKTNIFLTSSPRKS